MDKKTAIIDVDSILWGFNDILYEELVKSYPLMEKPDKWNIWEFYEKYDIPEEEFYKVCNKIHKNQELYKPFKYSSFLSYLLVLNDYHVVIASCRIPETKKNLIKWLNRNDIIYDEVFASLHKKHLFDKADLVIDDSPINLIEASKRGANLICGLLYPWNKELSDTFMLCEDLKELIARLGELGVIKIK
jgi:5'(3')-deoxyribonucleotidase